MVDLRRRGRREKFLDLADGRSFFELHFVQLNLVSFFKSAHQFDAIERTKLQITFEASGFGVQLNGMTGNFCYESGQRGVVRSRNLRARSCAIYDFADAREDGFLRGRPRKIRFWPKKPVTDLLIFRQRTIGVFDRGGCV